MNLIFFSRREGRARHVNLAHPVTLGAVGALALGVLGVAFVLGLELGQRSAAARPGVRGFGRGGGVGQIGSQESGTANSVARPARGQFRRPSSANSAWAGRLKVLSADTRFDRCHFAKHAAASLDFETVCYVLSADFNRYMDIQQAINLRLHRELAQLGVEFAYPTQRVFVMPAGAADSPPEHRN